MESGTSEFEGLALANPQKSFKRLPITRVSDFSQVCPGRNWGIGTCLGLEEEQRVSQQLCLIFAARVQGGHILALFFIAAALAGALFHPQTHPPNEDGFAAAVYV